MEWNTTELSEQRMSCLTQNGGFDAMAVQTEASTTCKRRGSKLMCPKKVKNLPPSHSEAMILRKVIIDWCWMIAYHHRNHRAERG
mmetsp:Transcript_27356/g.56643  ORF Transcript_27356/g.56643 Transcript_27356/m.56643 type:complete len:85 (+) Transcript_27356:305-559(+)